MADEDRYHRQALFREIGAEGQQRIGNACAVVVGVGALGCQEATLLARAGVGRLRLADRDVVERTNLQRQILFDEEDARAALPKAEAAAATLRRANSAIAIEARVQDVTAANLDTLLAGATVIVDGTDNFETRYLVNDWAVKHGVPWIYAAAVGATGLVMPVLPGETACLRCVFEEPPPAGAADTCDTAGVLGSITSVVGAIAAAEALKVAAGRADAVRRGLLQVDLWDNDARAVTVAAARDDCPCCGLRRFPFLDGRAGGGAALCGRDGVQVTPAAPGRVDLAAVKARLAASLDVRDNGFLLHFRAGDLDVLLFEDGRAIVKGTTDPAAARSCYARYVGL